MSGFTFGSGGGGGFGGLSGSGGSMNAGKPGPFNSSGSGFGGTPAAGSGFGAASTAPAFGTGTTGGGFGTSAQPFGFGGNPTVGGFGSGSEGPPTGFGTSGTPSNSLGSGFGFGSSSSTFGSKGPGTGFGTTGATFGSTGTFGAGAATFSSSATFGRGSSFGGPSGAPTAGAPSSALGGGSSFGDFASATSSSFGGLSGMNASTFGGSSTFGTAMKSLNPAAAPFNPSSFPRGPSAPTFLKKKPEPSNSLFVKLPFGSNLSEQVLHQYFSRFGNVESITLRPNNKCFVKMSTVAEAQSVMAQPVHDYGLVILWDQFANPPSGPQSVQPLDEDDTMAEKPSLDVAAAEKKEEELKKKKALLARLEALKAAKQNKTVPATRSKSPSSTKARSASIEGASVSSAAASTAASLSASPVPASPVPADLGSSFVVGTCTLMCPLSETHKRMQANQVELLEMPHPELPQLGSDPEKLTIMKFQRSAAAETMSVPELIRTPEALDQTANYMWLNILDRDSMGPDPRFRDSPATGGADRPSLLVVNNFIMDRMKRMIQEFGMQGFSQDGGPLSPQAMRIYEECARCHIVLAYEMQESYNKPGEGYSERLHNESLNNTLKALLEMYKRAGKTGSGVSSDCEPEIQAYYMLLQLNAKEQSSSLIVQEIHKKWRASAIVSLAKRAYDAFFSGDFFTYFQIFRTAPFLFACLLRRGLDRVRKVGLCHLNGSCARDSRFPLDRFARFFCFDNEKDAADYCRVANIEVIQGASGAYIVLGKEGTFNASLSEETKTPCKSLGLKRGTVPRRMLVGDISRDWIAQEMQSPNSPLRHLRAPVEHVAPKSSSSVPNPQVLQERNEAQKLQERLRKDREIQDQLERKKREEEERMRLQKLKDEEEKRKRAAEDLQRKRDEEEAARKLAQQLEAEKRRREEQERLALLERERKRREQQEAEEKRRKLIEAREKSLTGIARTVHPRVLDRRRLRASLSKWRSTAEFMRAQIRGKAARVRTVQVKVQKGRVFRDWRRLARRETGAMEALRAVNRVLKRRTWTRFVQELGGDIEHRVTRFRRSLLPVIDEFPQLSEPTLDGGTGSARLDRQSSSSVWRSAVGELKLAPVSTDVLLDAMDLCQRGYLKICAVHFDRGSTADKTGERAAFVDWILAPFGKEKADARILLTQVTFDSDDTTLEQSASTADVILVMRGELAGKEERALLQRLKNVANSSVAFSSPLEIPVLEVALAEMWIDLDGNEENTQANYTVVLDNFSHVVNLDRMEQAWRWVIATTANRVQRVEVKEVPFETFILSHFPRFKWSSFINLRDWLRDGVRTLKEAAEELEQASLACSWPAPDLVRAFPSEFREAPPLDWNAKDRVQTQTLQILRCAEAIPMAFEKMDQMFEFASQARFDRSAVENLLFAARGDGLWCWEHLVGGLLRSLVSRDWVVYAITPGGIEDKAKRSLLQALREPPNAARTREPATLGEQSAAKKRPRTSRSQSESVMKDEAFEQTLKRYLQEGENVSRPQQVTDLVQTHSATTETSSSAEDIVLRARIERVREEAFLAKLKLISQLQ